MRRFTMIAALLLMVAMPMFAERVTPETARKVASTFLTNNGAKAAQLADLSKSAGFPNLYIFSTETSFVVMSADDCAKPILGYSLTNKFVAEGMPENISSWLQGYSDEIQWGIDNQVKVLSEVTKQWKDLSAGKPDAAKATTVVDALVQTTWDQNPRYNNLCPYSSYYKERTVTGCVATAMAQIMKYWNRPSNGIGSHSYVHTAYTDSNGNYHDAMGELSANFSATTYDWTNMPSSLSSSSTADQINAVATLMYHCGVSVEMDYGIGNIGGSGAVTAYVATALQTYFNYQPCTFKYKAENEASWVSMLKTELNASRPIQYSGRGSKGGHSFVCDGYDSDDKFHFNWGWSGENDGFYALDNLVPGSGGAGGGSFSFTNNQGAIFGIQPASIGTAGAPTNLTTTLIQETGRRDVNLAWVGGSGAASYIVYRDSQVIDTVSSEVLTLLDVRVPYGTHEYYVRSVDSDGNLSWPSNYAVITLTFSAPADFSATAGSVGNLLSWNTVNNALSYNVYCNNTMIDNVTTLTYTDTRTITGTLTYFVKAVDEFGDESNASENRQLNIDYQTPSVNNLSAERSGNTANLSWVAPQWCYPQTASHTVTYGSGEFNGNVGYGGEYCMYWGHQYLPLDLSAYAGKNIYKVSFYARHLGVYQLLIYEGTKTVTNNDNDYDVPDNLVAIQTWIASATGWLDIDLNTPISIDQTKDLWVMIYDPEYKQTPATYCTFTSHNRGNHVTTNPESGMLNYPNVAWLIRTYLTDGTYTYNLYRDDEKIAEDIEGTTYSNAALSDNAPNLFTVKTNYYGGETAASNIAGFAKGTTSLTKLEMGNNDKMTVTENSTLTVIGTLSNDNPANLILEDGAQLIHSSSGVKATVKKSITPYTSSENGWHFIASPVTESITPSDGNGFLPDGSIYDLYYYEESAHHWRNYRAKSFDLAYKQGYLYANNVTTTLQFAGTLTPSDNAFSINNLSHEATILNGFNLVGNPFACNATIDQDCYVISGRQVTKLAPADKTFAPCEGAFVKATSDNEYTVTFTKSGAKSNSNGACLDLVVTQGDNQSWKDGAPTGSTAFDRARVRFGKGIGMEKFDLNDSDDIRLTLWQNGQDFAVAYANGLDELPLNFKVAENGTYTLGIESNSLNLDYLHLIDNMTGADVDLLATPTYTFEAKVTDYASRFRLVFSNKSICEDTDSDNAFAFISNGEIVINGASNDATLQIIDVTGRVITTTGVVRNVSTNGMPAGVYVLRLVTNNGVKTQKMIIE